MAEARFLTVLEAGGPGPACRPRWLLLKPVSLACGRPRSCCLFTQSSFPARAPRCLSVCPDVLLSGRHPSGRGNACQHGLVSLNPHFKGSVSKYGHIRKYWGQGFSVHVFWWGHIQPIAAKDIVYRNCSYKNSVFGFSWRSRILWRR